MGGIDYSSLVQKHMSNFSSYTNVNTTTSSYSAPSTANQIADALLGVGSMAAMMAIAAKSQGGSQVSSNMSAKTSAMAARAKAQATINIFSPKVADLKAQIAADANYTTQKTKLEGQLAELNEKAGATKNKDDVPQIAANLQSARADMNSWTQKAQEYARNDQGMKDLAAEKGSTPKGLSFNYLENGKANIQNSLEDFGYNKDKPETKSAAETAMRQFNATAKQKETNYATLKRNNETIENQAKTIKTYDEGGKEVICSTTPDKAAAVINESIKNLENIKLGSGTNEMSPDAYLQEKADIESQLKELESNHSQINTLKTRLTSYETKIEEAQITIAEADATIAEIDGKAAQVDANKSEINGLKSINKGMKKEGGAKKFLGIQIGNKYSETQKLARQQNRDRIAQLKAQNQILDS